MKILCLIKGHIWEDNFDTMRPYYGYESGRGYLVDYWFCKRCGLRKTPDEMRSYGVRITKIN